MLTRATAKSFIAIANRAYDRHIANIEERATLYYIAEEIRAARLERIRRAFKADGYIDFTEENPRR